MKFRWYDAFWCMIGKHFIGGWSKTADGVYTSDYWCWRCKVRFHDDRTGI